MVNRIRLMSVRLLRSGARVLAGMAVWVDADGATRMHGGIASVPATMGPCAKAVAGTTTMVLEAIHIGQGPEMADQFAAGYLTAAAHYFGRRDSLAEAAHVC